MPATKLPGKPVLVADPSPFMAELTADMLRAIGITRITTVSTSHDAVRALQARSYLAMIIDEGIGPDDGVALTRRLRNDADSPNRAIALIMVCDAPTRALIDAARDAGVTEFIRKPMSAAILESRLKQALDKPRDFVETATYTGPDRRRRSIAPREGGERRRG